MASNGTITKVCPVRKCLNGIPLHHVLCRQHWDLVSDPLKRAIIAHWEGGRLPNAQGKNVQLLIRQARDEAYDAARDEDPGS